MPEDPTIVGDHENPVAHRQHEVIAGVECDGRAGERERLSDGRPLDVVPEDPTIVGDHEILLPIVSTK